MQTPCFLELVHTYTSMTNEDKKIQGLVAVTRTDSTDDTLTAWLDWHLRWASKAIVLINVRPDEDPAEAVEVCKKFGDRVRYEVLETTHFDNKITIDTLNDLVLEDEENEVVFHLDKDEFISWGDRFPYIVERVRSGESDYAESRMIDRFGVGLSLIEGGHKTLDSLREAAPVQTVLMSSYNCAEEKCYLTRAGELYIHHPTKPRNKDWQGMLVEHYRWDTKCRERTKTKVTQHREYIREHIESRDMEVVNKRPRFRRIAKEKFRSKGEILPGWFDYPDLYKQIAEEAREGETFVELGVYAGKSLSYFAEYATLLGKKLEVIGYDQFNPDYYLGLPPWKYSLRDNTKPVATQRDWLLRVIKDLKFTAPFISPRINIGDATEVAKNHKDGSVFAVFIDAGHDAISVEKDVRAWWPKITPNGILAGHDYNMSSVKEGLKLAGLSVEPTSKNCWVARKPSGKK